jgi:hypothetical protein
LFTDTLLSELDSEELIAIFCHELAHLEYFDRARLRSHLRFEIAVLAVLAVGIPAATRLTSWGALGTLISVCLVVFAWTWWRASGTQRRETESDARALALCGNADALISALTKVYVLHRLPRRWSAETEQTSSHPSLARRIQHIRGLLPGLPEAPMLDTAVAAMSKTGDSAIVLDHDRFHIASAIPAGVPPDPDGLRRYAGSLRSVVYSQLTELRVRVARGSTSLVARTRAGENWSIPIETADLARVQQALDRIDVRLGVPVAPGLNPTIVRLVAVSVMLGASALDEWSLTLVALLTVLLPGSTTCVSLSAAIVVTALLKWRDMSTIASPQLLGAVGAVVAFGVVLAAVSLRRWEPPRPAERINVAVATLAGATLIAWIVLAVAATGALYLAHQTARSHAMVVLPLAAAAILRGCGGFAKRSSPLFAILSVLPFLLGSDWFASTVIRDPLLNGAEITLRRASLREVDRAPVGLPANRVVLSPSGRRFIARSESDGDDRSTLFADGEFGSAETDEFSANAAAWAGEDRLLAVRAHQDRLTVRLAKFPTKAGDDWTIDLPPLVAPIVQFDDGTRTWSVAGLDKSRFRRFAGMVSGERTGDTAWELGDARPGAFVRWHAGPGPYALAVEARARRSPLSVTWFTPPEWIYDTTIWRVGRDRRERLLDTVGSVECSDAIDDDGRFVCSAAVTGETFYWSIDPAGGTPRSLGAIHGEFWDSGLSASAVTGYFAPRGPALILFSGPEPAGYVFSWDAGWIAGVDRENRVVTGSADDAKAVRRSEVVEARPAR